MEREDIVTSMTEFRETWKEWFGDYPKQEEVIQYANDRIEEMRFGLLGRYFGFMDHNQLKTLIGIADENTLKAKDGQTRRIIKVG